MIQKYFHVNANRNFSIVMIWINGGSDMDGEGGKGINQILCSLLNRGCKGFENLELSEFIDSYGAELNHEISEDGMLISLKSLNEHFDKLFPLVDLIINKPLLSETQFQNVKRTTINSIRKDKENPFNIAFEKWRKLVYEKHPYAFNCMGYEQDILKINHNDILYEYEKFKSRNKYLISNNLNINDQSLDSSNQNISKEFFDYPNLNLNKKNTFVSTHQKSNQIILMIGNQTCSQLSYEYIPLKILESHLSYGMSSILFKLFREKNGLTYEVGTFNPIRKQNSPFLIYLSVSNKDALLTFQILLELWHKLLSSLLTDNEIDLAKEKLRSSFLISNQSLEEILQRRIQLIGYGLDPNFDMYFLTKIQEINSKDILKITKKYFSKPSLSILGDENICNDIENIWIKNF